MEKFDVNNPNNNKGGPFRIKWLGLFAAMFWAFFFALALSNVLSPYFSQIISGLLSGITPLLLGIVVAFIFYRLVDFIEKVILKNAFKNSPYKFAIKRTISITIVLLIIIGIIALVFAILVPKIVEIVQRLTAGGGDGGTQIYNNVVNEICAILQRWFGTEISQDAIKEVLNGIFEFFMQTVGYINNLLELSMNVLSGLLNVLIGMLLAILMLKDKEKITKFTRRFTYANFKKERADELCVMAHNANNILYNYVICKLIEFAIIFVSLGITYSIMGLEFTWELSLIIGLFNFIPYFGIYIGALPAVLITLIFNSVNQALYMAIATIIITTIEFNVIVPIITGNRLKVSSLLIVGSIVVGGAMFGIMGMLLAPPLIALISVVVTGNIELKENHMKYVMELNKARQKSLQEEQERLGIENNEENAASSITAKNKAENTVSVSSVKENGKEEKASTKKEEKPEIKKEVKSAEEKLKDKDSTTKNKDTENKTQTKKVKVTEAEKDEETAKNKNKEAVTKE